MTETNDPTPGANVVPFGKHRARDIVELIEADPTYIQWLTGQDWFRQKFVTLHQTIINRGTESEETPDHNALQVLFLDDEFCRRFFLARATENLKWKEEGSAHRRTERDSLADPGTEIAFTRRFEDEGMDVVLNAYVMPRDSFLSACGIEIKPVVGDDYPAVLRQMRRSRSNVLFLKSYTGVGATREQFIKTFNTSGIDVVFLEQCR